MPTTPTIVRLGDLEVGPHRPPVIVAELSANHGGSLERALDLITAAAEAGAHAVKLQTYTPDTMTLDIDDREFFIDDPESLWHGRSLYDLYDEARTPWEWHPALFERCREVGLTCFSSPFDGSAVAFLEGLGVPCYKLASFEVTDLPLLRRMAATGKPIIMSTGMGSAAELDEAVRCAREAGCRELILLKCTSTYPADPAASNLRTVPHLAALFGTQVGLSDHTPGIGAAVASVALGVTLIEKHFTLNRSDGSVDAAFSLEPDEMRALVIETERAWRALGTVHYGPTTDEQRSLKSRRSLYVVADLRVGDVITVDNIRAVRPGLGLPPRYLEVVLGARIACDVAKGTPLTWDLLMPRVSTPDGTDS